MPLEIDILPGTFAVHRLPPSATLPADLFSQDFYAILRSAQELSVVTRSSHTLTSDQVHDGWLGLCVRGPLDFSLKGIMAKISSALAAADVSVFVVSSYDTDYVLIPYDDRQQGFTALTNAGIAVHGTVC